MYINIDEKFFEENKEKAREESIANIGDEGKENLIFDTEKDNIDHIEVDNDMLTIGINTELGYFSLDIPIDSFLIETIIGEVIKRMNKFKTMLEALK